MDRWVCERNPGDGIEYVPELRRVRSQKFQPGRKVLKEPVRRDPCADRSAALVYLLASAPLDQDLCTRFIVQGPGYHLEA